MTDSNPTADELARIIVLLYGLLGNGGPFWVFAAVRPAKYQGFLDAQKSGALDLRDFKAYGEVIVSGEGKSPPDEITLKVAEMYQSDSEALLQAAHSED